MRGGGKRKFETDVRVVGQNIRAALSGFDAAKVARDGLDVVVLSVVLGGRRHREVEVEPNCIQLDLS